MRAWSRAFLAVAVLALSGCGYNTLQAKDEAVKAAWSEVVNQYQRRADLIPNLVNTVKGYAAQEQKVLIGVTEARANRELRVLLAQSFDLDSDDIRILHWARLH